MKDQQDIIDKIYFIRHNLAGKEEVEKHCLSKKQIAIHFNDEFFTDYNDYSPESKEDKGFKPAFDKLENLGKQGGLVVAQFNKREFYLGRVTPNTSITKWKKVYKMLQLKSLKGPYFYSQFPQLSALRPQYKTIAPLSEYANNIVSHLFDGEPLELVLTNLHPQMLEQMVEEWLRSDIADGKYKINFELLKTGKTMPDIDIYAETKSKKDLFVQVTHATNDKEVIRKAKILKEYIHDRNDFDNSIGLFAGRARYEDEITRMGLDYISIESIFENFLQIPEYRRMLEKMIGIRSVI